MPDALKRQRGDSNGDCNLDILGWYGCVMRREEGLCCYKSDGDGCAGKRRKGGPKQRWINIIKQDLAEKGLSGEETQH